MPSKQVSLTTNLLQSTSKQISFNHHIMSSMYTNDVPLIPLSFTLHIFRYDIPLSPFIAIPLLGSVGDMTVFLSLRIFLRGRGSVVSY